MQQAVTFCIDDDLDMLTKSIIFVNDLTVFLKQCGTFGYWVKEICNYLTTALKTEEAIAPFPDAINLNIAFHQLVKKWLLWGYFVEKNY